jgi:hypothetical protein
MVELKILEGMELEQLGMEEQHRELVLVMINNNSNHKLQTWIISLNQRLERWLLLPSHKKTKMKVGEMLEHSLTDRNILIFSTILYSYNFYKQFQIIFMK